TYFAHGGKVGKTPPGDGSRCALCAHIRLSPGLPLRGSPLFLWVVRSGAWKSVCVGVFPPGPQGPGSRKFAPFLGSKLCAWVLPLLGRGWMSARPSTEPSPFEEGAPEGGG